MSRLTALAIAAAIILAGVALRKLPAVSQDEIREDVW